MDLPAPPTTPALSAGLGAGADAAPRDQGLMVPPISPMTPMPSDSPTMSPVSTSATMTPMSNTNANLMAIAMPQVYSFHLNDQQIAEQLRAAAPEQYED